MRDPVSRLIFELSKLPGIGEKTATRLSYFILKQDTAYARALAGAVLDAKEKIRLCGQCFTFTDNDPCRICSNPSREQRMICVVEKPSDVFSIEQSGVYRGIYHVLHGALSPLDGIGPDELKIKELVDRVRARMEKNAGDIREVILATNPSVEGEATSLYISRLLKSFGIRVSQLAYGLPVGGMLEYADKQTIGKALENRLELAPGGLGREHDGLLR